MCGIAGWVNATDASSEDAVEKALATLEARGPDGFGLSKLRISRPFNGTFGHRRLSIIDLSSAGQQPYCSIDGRFCLTYNGEIYNYLELREDLERLGWQFRSKTDTEVLLASWITWGKECLLRFTGMFAFAIFDNKTQILTCVRDPFGIKPLFFHHDNSNFVFCSEVPALLTFPSVGRRIDAKTSAEYLLYGLYDRGRATFIEGVNSMLPGELVEAYFSQGQVRIAKTQWWIPGSKKQSSISKGDAIEQVRAEFLKSVRLHLRSDVPVGIALSGGVDSSAIACGVRHIEPDAEINTFSFISGTKDLSEERWVKKVNAATRANEHQITISGDDLLMDLDKLILAQGEPFGSTSIYAGFKVAQAAKAKGMKVLLEGQGADELLGGYDGYPSQMVRSLIEQGNLFAALSFLNQWRRWPGRSGTRALRSLADALIPAKVKLQLKNNFFAKNSVPWINKELLRQQDVFFNAPNVDYSHGEKGRRVIEKLISSLRFDGLPQLLRHGDRNSMFSSIEGRVPFLTTEMADLCLSLQEDLLVSPMGETKHVFRAAMRGLVPDEILDRRDKIGFATPEKQWIGSQQGPLLKMLQESEFPQLLDRQEVIKGFQRTLEGDQPFSWLLWRWINFVRWSNLLELH